MGSVAGRWTFSCALFHFVFVSFICGLNEITAPLGQTVRLTCRGQDDIIGLILTRPDLDPRYVFVFRDNRPDLTRQNQLFRDRVMLPGPLETDDDGNVVLYLSNVRWSDNGTYICQALKGPVETSVDVRVVESDGGTTSTEEPRTKEPRTKDPPNENTFNIKLTSMYVCGLFIVAACIATVTLITDCLGKNEMK